MTTSFLEWARRGRHCYPNELRSVGGECVRVFRQVELELLQDNQEDIAIHF